MHLAEPKEKGKFIKKIDIFREAANKVWHLDVLNLRAFCTQSAKAMKRKYSIEDGDIFDYSPWGGPCVAQWVGSELWMRRADTNSTEGTRIWKTQHGGGAKLLRGDQVLVQWDNGVSVAIRMVSKDRIWRAGDDFFERRDTDWKLVPHAQCNSDNSLGHQRFGTATECTSHCENLLGCDLVTYDKFECNLFSSNRSLHGCDTTTYLWAYRRLPKGSIGDACEDINHNMYSTSSQTISKAWNKLQTVTSEEQLMVEECEKLNYCNDMRDQGECYQKEVQSVKRLVMMCKCANTYFGDFCEKKIPLKSCSRIALNWCTAHPGSWYQPDCSIHGAGYHYQDWEYCGAGLRWICKKEWQCQPDTLDHDCCK